MSEVPLYAPSLYPGRPFGPETAYCPSGDRVKFDREEVLSRSWGPTVGHMRLLAT